MPTSQTASENSPQPNTILRDLAPTSGSDNPRLPGNPFYLDNGTEMLEIRLDATNVIGPRPATDRDRADHSEAYAAFKALTKKPAEPAQLAVSADHERTPKHPPKRRGRPPSRRPTR